MRKGLKLIHKVFRVVAATILALQFPTAAAADLEFKGLRIGAQTTPGQVHESLALDCGEGYEGIQVCNGPTTVAGSYALANIVIGKSGRLERIFLSLDSEHFDGVFLALVEKLGNPDKLSEPMVQNRLGAKYKDLRAQWNRKNGTRLSVTRYSGSLDKSEIYFSTAGDRDVMAGGSIKQKAKDL